jgi:hypothetical protein
MLAMLRDQPAPRTLEITEFNPDYDVDCPAALLAAPARDCRTGRAA